MGGVCVVVSTGVCQGGSYRPAGRYILKARESGGNGGSSAWSHHSCMELQPGRQGDRAEDQGPRTQG